MTAILTAVLVVGILSVLILIHELGHFIVGKRSGMAIAEFGLGYPPRVLTIATIGETAYTINVLPFGGFVRFVDEENPSVPGSFAAKSPLVRAAVLLAGSGAHLLLAVAIYFGLSLSNPTPEQILTTEITGVVPTSPAYEAGLRPGDVIVSVDGEVVENRYDYLRQQVERLGGQEVELVINRDGQILPPIYIVPRADPPPNEGPLGVGLGIWIVGIRVTSVEPGSLADEAGIRRGDLFIDVADHRVSDEEELAAFLKEHAGWRVSVRVARDGKALDPIFVQIPDEVSARDATLGLSFHPSVPMAVMASLRNVGRVVVNIPVGLLEVFRRSAPANSVLGPIGIAQATGEVASSLGLVGVLEFAALLAATLAVVNLLPIPALDGGRLVFVLLEAVRGRRIDPHKERYVHLIGMALLVSLLIVVTVFSDIPRLLRGESILPR